MRSYVLKRNRRMLKQKKKIMGRTSLRMKM